MDQKNNPPSNPPMTTRDPFVLGAWHHERLARARAREDLPRLPPLPDPPPQGGREISAASGWVAGRQPRAAQEEDRTTLRDVAAAFGVSLVASALALAAVFALGAIFLGPPPFIEGLLR
jgi:hypothetical protein